MFKVYWTENGARDRSETFGSSEMTLAMKLMEDLRKAHRDGVGHNTFITMVSENPDSVGQAGVDVTGPEYKDQWDKKHRGAGPEKGVTYRTKP